MKHLDRGEIDLRNYTDFTTLDEAQMLVSEMFPETAQENFIESNATKSSRTMSRVDTE
jgi:hypothetical protein